MSEKELEISQDENLDLEEAKASMGDPSEVPEPTTKEVEAPGGKGQDVDKKKGAAQGSSNVKAPKTKIGMLNAMVDKMKGMKKAELAAAYAKTMGEEVEVEETAVSIKEMRQITAEDVNVAEDIDAIFGGQDLSEEFVEKAQTVFEAAVVSKVNEILETVTVDLEAELEAEKEEISESISTKLDDYLEYVAEEWMKENELAVEQGIRSEIVENFMVGLRNLFAENYIDIPEEKVDLVDELASKVEELEGSINEEMEKSIELRKELVEQKKVIAMSAASEGLTESQAVKLASLAEGVDFVDEDSYQEKLDTLKETYFAAEAAEELTEEVAVDEEPVEISEEAEDAIDPAMAQYIESISRSLKK